MVKLRYILTVPVITYFFTSCYIFYKHPPIDDKSFTYYKKHKIESHQASFSKNGFYYMKGESNNCSESYHIFYLYEDGTYRTPHNICSSLLAIERDSSLFFKNPERNNNNISPTNWGAFIVSNDTLKIQRFIADDNPFSATYKVYEEHAKIMNDTTLNVFGLFKKGKIIAKVDFIYHFRQCDFKLDSLNYAKFLRDLEDKK